MSVEGDGAGFPNASDTDISGITRLGGHAMNSLSHTPSEISVTRTTTTAVVELRGDVDLRIHTQLRDVLADEVDAGRHLVIDLRAVDFLDSTGIGAFVGALRRARDREAVEGRRRTHIALVVSPGGDVERTLGITGLTQVFPLFHRLEAAESLVTED
jgi:anti-sigma B factor antagonist